MASLTTPTVIVALADIKQSFSVRLSLDSERVALFESLYRTGADLPPLLLTTENELLDGRHRKAALENLGRSEALCTRRTVTSTADAIMIAFTANLGGALPPSQGDMQKVVRLLIAEKLSMRSIVDLMAERANAMPRRYISKMVDDVRTAIKKAAVDRAARAVLTEGKTLDAAAEEFGVESEQVRLRLSADGIRGDAQNVEAEKLANVLSGLSTSFKSVSRVVGSNLKHALKMHELGAVEDDYVHAILRDVSSRIRRLQKSQEDWERRFAEQSKTVDDAHTKVVGVSKTKKSRKASTTTDAKSKGIASADDALRKMGLVP